MTNKRSAKVTQPTSLLPNDYQDTVNHSRHYVRGLKKLVAHATASSYRGLRRISRRGASSMGMGLHRRGAVADPDESRGSCQDGSPRRGDAGQTAPGWRIDGGVGSRCGPRGDARSGAGARDGGACARQGTSASAGFPAAAWACLCRQERLDAGVPALAGRVRFDHPAQIEELIPQWEICPNERDHL